MYRFDTTWLFFTRCFHCVQAFETNLMYTYALNLGNYQYLIEDLFFTTVLAALMGFTEPRCGCEGAACRP